MGDGMNHPGRRQILRPKRVASWWSKLEDLSFPDPAIREKVKRRAAALAEAQVDTVLQFGFHLRFDFAPYFGALHGYLRFVAEELHRYDILFLDHYSCNLVARPNSEAETRKYHTLQRHCVNLYPDSIYARQAGYGGYRFDDLREIDVRTGDPAYSWSYQSELFCHGNPDFRQMHRGYLERLLSEVPVDGVQVDDMADYAYFTACGCRHCRERFLREYGRVLPPTSERKFWGDTSQDAYLWGNYANPAFREWTRMRFQMLREHFSMIRETMGEDRILMTCVSGSGPNYLNSLGMQNDGLVEYYDWIMLENNGLNVRSADWARVEPDAMLQRAFAWGRPGMPAIACSYSLQEAGAYLGWAVARFWGVVNWHSTLIQGLSTDMPDAKEEADLIGQLNRWEVEQGDPDPSTSKDVVEVRVVFDRFCKENGWTDESGRDHWAHASDWSRALLEHNIGYRFVRAEELADAAALSSESTPLVLDGCACLSDAQILALLTYAEQDRPLWIVPPLGTLDDRGFDRVESSVACLMKREYMGNPLLLPPSSPAREMLEKLIQEGRITPRIRQLAGDRGWKLRMRIQERTLSLHLLNQALDAIPHPTQREEWGAPSEGGILYGLRSQATEGRASFEIDCSDLDITPWNRPVLTSPELSDQRPVEWRRMPDHRIRIDLDLRGIDLYGKVGEAGAI